MRFRKVLKKSFLFDFTCTNIFNEVLILLEARKKKRNNVFGNVYFS